MTSEKVAIMPCLDLRDGRVVKGIQFSDIIDAGDPVECAKAYCQEGADELTLLDITATLERRSAMTDTVAQVAAVANIPFTVGGGIADLKSAEKILNAGADKVSISSAAYRKPELIPQLIKEFGGKAITVAIDLDLNNTMPSGYEVFIDGGKTATGTDALEWAKKIDSYGVEVILPTSKAGDGSKSGYDLHLISMLAENCQAKIVASGGAGTEKHFLEAAKAGAKILLAASVFHFQIINIAKLKKYLKENGIKVKA